MKRLATLLMCLLLCSCGVLRAPADDSWLPLAVGNTWTLRGDRTGRLVTFEVVAKVESAGCVNGEIYDVRITKQDDSDYWAPGSHQSVDFYIRKLPDGTLTAPLQTASDLSTGLPNSMVQMESSRAGEPPVDYVLGPQAEPGATVAMHYRYLSRDSPIHESVNSPMCLNAADPGTATWAEGYWKSEYTAEAVNVPAYRGPAMGARYSEGTEAAENNAERWYFARGVGLVQLVNLHSHFLGREYNDTYRLLQVRLTVPQDSR